MNSFMRLKGEPMNKNLYQKIYDIMNETKALPKDMSIAGQYKAISEAVVLNEIKPLLKKHRVIIFPIDVTSKQEGKLTMLETRFKIVDVESGESEVLAAPGNGADPQDKGSGKAWTYAYKALLQKTFMLFSGEDTDNTHSDEITKTVEKDSKKLNSLVDAFNGMTKERQDAALKHYKVKDVTDIPASIWDQATAMMLK